jgi:hypothetical protein
MEEVISKQYIKGYKHAMAAEEKTHQGIWRAIFPAKFAEQKMQEHDLKTGKQNFVLDRRQGGMKIFFSSFNCSCF